MADQTEDDPDKKPDPDAPGSRRWSTTFSRALNQTLGQTGKGSSADPGLNLVMAMFGPKRPQRSSSSSSTGGDGPATKRVPKVDDIVGKQIRMKFRPVGAPNVNTGNEAIDYEVTRVLAQAAGAINDFQRDATKAFNKIGRRLIALEVGSPALVKRIDTVQANQKTLADQMGWIIRALDERNKQPSANPKASNLDKVLQEKRRRAAGMMRDESGRFTGKKNTTLADAAETGAEGYVGWKTAKAGAKAAGSVLGKAGSAAVKMAPMAGIAGLGVITSKEEDDIVEEAKNKSQEAKKKYGKELVAKARAKYQPWYRYSSIDSDDPNDEKYVLQYMQEQGGSSGTKPPASSSGGKGFWSSLFGSNDDNKQTEKKDYNLTAYNLSIDVDNDIELTAKRDITLKGQRLVLDFDEIKFRVNKVVGVSAGAGGSITSDSHSTFGTRPSAIGTEQVGPNGPQPLSMQGIQRLYQGTDSGVLQTPKTNYGAGYSPTPASKQAPTFQSSQGKQTYDASDVLGGMGNAPAHGYERRSGEKGEFNYFLSKGGKDFFGDPSQGSMMSQGKIVTVSLNSGKTIQVHEKVAERSKAFLDELEGRGYNIKSLGGYANRANVNSPGRLSTHASGGTFDINPGSNPNKGRTTDMPQNIEELAFKHGFSWGGRFGDPMHFETMSPEARENKLKELVRKGVMTQDQMKSTMDQWAKWEDPSSTSKLARATPEELKKNEMDQLNNTRSVNPFLKKSAPSPTSDQPVSQNSDGSKTLAEQRAPYMDQINKDPKLAHTAMAMMLAEEGGDSTARKALLETVLNRSAAHGYSDLLGQGFNTKYYEPFHNGSFNKNLQKVIQNPDLREKLMKEIEEVGKGSNVSDFATQNASGSVGRHARQTQTVAFVGDNKEVFSRKDNPQYASLHGPAYVQAEKNWYERSRIAQSQDKPAPGGVLDDGHKIPEATAEPKKFDDAKSGSIGKEFDTTDNSMLGAMDGDMAMAAAINKKSQDQAKIKSPDPLTAGWADVPSAFDKPIDNAVKVQAEPIKQSDDEKAQASKSFGPEPDRRASERKTEERNQVRADTTIKHPRHEPEAAGPTPGSDGYGTQCADPDGNSICSI